MAYYFKILVIFKCNKTFDLTLESFLLRLHSQNIKVEYVAITEYKPFISNEASRVSIMCNVGDFGKEFLEKMAKEIPTQISLHQNNFGANALN